MHLRSASPSSSVTPSWKTSGARQEKPRLPTCVATHRRSNYSQILDSGLSECKLSSSLNLFPPIFALDSSSQFGVTPSLKLDSIVKVFSVASSSNDNGNGCIGPYPRPKRIILVRHGESEGNVDESAYTRIPDSKIALTQNGWDQAVKCGQKIRQLLEDDGEPDWKIYAYVSPYLRTLQTLKGIGLNFERKRIAGVREEPRLREQDFGNFQCRERMREEKAIRLRYGRFFYRFPDGESAADVYDRVTGFRETLKADIDVGRFQKLDTANSTMNLLIVSHGLTLRVFLMRWYKWTVEQFHGLYNLSNTGMLIMQLGPGGRYSLTMHHSRDELKAFGMTDDMIDDQDWQKFARPGDFNENWFTGGSKFFDHLDFLENGKLDQYVPQDLSSLKSSDSPAIL